MGIKAVLFDLDGTLLPMDQDTFVGAYISLLAKKIAPLGYAPEKIAKALLLGCKDMIASDGSKLNEEIFWESFTNLLGPSIKKHMPSFNDFYEKEFDTVQAACGFSPKAKEIVDFIRERGVRIILATNPLFPAIATEKRIGWAGLSSNDFDIITTYENSHFCKPNIKYYEEILSKSNLDAKDCIMVGNDADEDTVAEELGMKVFLLTDCLINRNQKDISKYRNGNFEKLQDFIEELL